MPFFYEWSVKDMWKEPKNHPKPKFSIFIGELLLIKYMFIVKNTERSNLRSLYRHCFNSCLTKHRVNSNFLKGIHGDKIHHGRGHMASGDREQRVNRKWGWAIKCKSPLHSGLLPPARFHFLRVPQLFKNVVCSLGANGQTCKLMGKFPFNPRD